MTEPSDRPLAASPWAQASCVAIPTLWTADQALAVFELLDDLRDRIWALYGCQIQDLLREERGVGDPGARSPGDERKRHRLLSRIRAAGGRNHAAPRTSPPAATRCARRMLASPTQPSHPIA